MIISRPRHLRLVAVGMVALAASFLVACAPEADPTPTPTAAFASEEEAFAAAEEVYRAYTQALNDHRAGQEDADPLSFLTGTALEDELQSQRDLEANHLSIHGDTEVVGFEPVKADLIDGPTVVGIACLDLSNTVILDSGDQDVTPEDRDEKAALAVSFVWDSTTLLISESALSESGC